MSGKSLFALAFLVTAGTLANAQCPTPTRTPCQFVAPVTTNCNVPCYRINAYPTCSTPQYKVVVTNTHIVSEIVTSPVYYPTTAVVTTTSPACGTCFAQGYSETVNVHVPTQVAETVVKPASSKCACTLRGIASTDRTNGREMNSIVERPNSATRSPFSEAGHVRPGSGRVEPNPCEIEFLECCASGGKNCAANYADCAEISGEKVKHALCPESGPDPSARPKTNSTEKANTTSPVTNTTGVRGT